MIWIIGSNGMLGRELAALLEEKNIPYTGTDRDVSILDSSALKEFAENNKPSWIVNCSGYTAVDKAESDRDAAFAINAEGVKNIASLAVDLDIPLIHISTDYVFNGTSRIPLSEDAPVSPVSVYGESKLAGEGEIRNIYSKHFIIRTAWLYGQYGPNFVYTMIKLMNSRDSIKVVDDQHGSPTWTFDLANLIFNIISEGSNSYGTYHFSGEGECTWYGFAESIYKLGKEREIIKSDCVIEPCLSNEFPTPAKRPAYSLLSKEKVKTVFDFPVPSWEESLIKFMERFLGLFNRITNWIEHADYDLDTAKAMHKSERYLYVFITCQQNLEKNFKALLDFRGMKIPRIHDLVRLNSLLNVEKAENEIQLFKDLSYYYIASRYSERVSALSAEISRDRSEYIIEKTEEVSKWIKSMIPFLNQ